MDRRVTVLVLLLALLVLTGAYGGLNAGVDEASSVSAAAGGKFVDLRDGRLVEYGFDRSEDSAAIPNLEGDEYAGLVEGNVTTVPGKDGSAVRFDGLDGRVVVADSTDVPVENGMAFAVWLNPESDQQGNVLKAKGSFAFFIGWNTVYFAVFQEGNQTAELRAEIPTDEWTHVAGVYDPEAGVRLYVNGEPADRNASVRGPIDSPAENVTLNAGTWKSGFNGSVDEFALWTRPLSESEVQLAAQGRDRGLIFSEPLRIGTTVLVLLLIVGVTIRGRIF